MAGLQEHFRPPLSLLRHWHSFLYGWATVLAADLNARLPPDWLAEASVAFGVEIEEIEGGSGWAAHPPSLTIPLPILTDVVEVLVFDQRSDPTLAGAIQLVCPAKRSGPEYGRAFVTKCAATVEQGVGLLIVDVVTGRGANLHTALLAHLQAASPSLGDAELYAAAYRPVSERGEASLEIWEAPMALGQALPTMPLWLRGGLCLPVDLDATYERTCREQRIPTDEV